MKVLYIAAECKPFSKTGGVGDVAGELPAALKAEGIDIEIITPCYGHTLRGSPVLPGARSVRELAIEFHGVQEHVNILHTRVKDVPVNLVKNSTYFEKDYSRDSGKAPFEDMYLFRNDYSSPYVSRGEIPFYDDAFRFSFLAEACIPLIEEKAPDIVHVNDWVSGYLMALLKSREMPQKRVLTIHNAGYQGNIHRRLIRGWNMEQVADHQELGPLFADPRPEWESVNCLRLAMELAHRTNTVSPTYKSELTRPRDQSRYFEGGQGLHEVTARLDSLGMMYGILNGFEYGFHPDESRFEALLREKAGMKAKLARDFPDPAGFLLGFVGRAVEQKFRLLAEELDGTSVLEHILALPGVNVAVLATGEKRYEDFLTGLSGWPNLCADIAFDAARARQISLGCDLFLMPSLFEPCGIAQMESLSCATPPLVRWTGGLADTVKPHTQAKGTGFGFDGSTRREVLQNLISCVREALELYKNHKKRFHALQLNGFRERFLWASSAGEYIEKIYGPVMDRA